MSYRKVRIIRTYTGEPLQAGGFSKLVAEATNFPFLPFSNDWEFALCGERLGALPQDPASL